jgi:hypothetical protein
MKEYKFSFWTEFNKSIKSLEVYGCSSHGFSNENTCITPTTEGNIAWSHQLPGEVLNGTYQSVLDSLIGLPFVPKVCIVLYKKAEGFEYFLTQVGNIFPNTSFIGGGASFVNGLEEGELIPEAEDVCVFAVSGDNYKVDTLNIYEDTNIQVEFEAASKREITKIKELPDGEWETATSFYKRKQIEFGIASNVFENLCFCDKNRRNLHCSISDDTLFVGANLPDKKILTLNYISHKKAVEKLKIFIDDTDSLIFGCAGIRSLINENVFTGNKSLAGFMFGEIVKCGEKVELGNLMLTKLKVL